MRRSRLSQYKQNKLIELFIAGVTARTAAQLVGVNKNTAAYYFHRLRLLIFHNSLHLEILAEGVENIEQMAMLKDMGCAMMQGYLVSAPLSADRAEIWLSQHCQLLQRQ